MHVLVAAHDFYPDPGSGGTGRYVYETARRLVDRGHRVSVVTRRRGDAAPRGTVAGIDVHRYGIDIAGESAPTILPQLPGAARAVARRVEAASADGPPDLLSFQGPVTSALVDRAVPDAVPRACTFHSPWPTEYDIKARTDPDLSGLRRRLNVRAREAVERRVLDAADRTYVLSEYMGGQLERVYGPTETRVIPGGVDLDRFSPDAGRYDRIDADGPAFLTVRRLSERMGHRLLIDAFARVADDRPGAELYVAGDGPLRGELERRARERGVADRVTFLGYVPDGELPAVHASADVFALPTTELEGFGLATLEALASGTPVVGTAVGGTVEALSGLDGRTPAPTLVEKLTPEAFGDAMSAWTALSPSERDAAGDRARAYVEENYGWEAVVDRLEASYADLVAGRDVDGGAGADAQSSPSVPT